MLTEAEIQRSFRKLFKKGQAIEADAFQKAEELLEELRGESPLRIRLLTELDELRKIHSGKKKKP